MSLWLWSLGGGRGAVAAATAMALRLRGMSLDHVEPASLFEVWARCRTASTLSPAAHRGCASGSTLTVPRWVRLRTSALATVRKKIVIDNRRRCALAKIGLIGRSGASRSTLVNLLLRFHDLDAGRVLIDGRDIAA
jgi:ATP-binding cassette subfamily B multidrug efflux pump